MTHWVGFRIGVAGGMIAAAICLYLILVAIGRVLKRRFGTRLGLVYQIFCAVFAGYCAAAFPRPGYEAARELGAAASLLGAGVLVRMLDQYFWRWYFEERRKAPIPKFIREVTALVVLVVALLLVLEFGYSVQVPGLLAASGVVGIILGFALQDSLGNIIGGFALQFGRPFVVGDWLLVDQQHAQAVEINWRSTRFVTNDAVQLDVPNQQIVRQTIVNYHGGGSLHAMRLEIGIQYDAAPNRVKDVLASAAASAPEVCHEPAPEVYLKAFGDSAIVYEVRFWLNDHRRYNATADCVRTNIWYALSREGLKIPFPIRTIHKEEPPLIAAGATTANGTVNGVTHELLAAQALFKGMSEANLQTLISRSAVHHYGRGETIIREGDDGASMFVLVAGEADVSVRMSEQQTRVATLNGGECFGEMSLLTGEARSASVAAVTDCEVMEIAKRTFAEIISRDPGLLQRLSELLARRQMANDGLAQAQALQPAVIAATEQEYQEGFLYKLRSFFEM